VSRTAEYLLDLSLSRGTLDRSAVHRREPGLLKAALGDSGTRVLDLVESRSPTCKVDGTLRLVFRSPTYADADRLVLYLGRDHEGTAYLAVVNEPGTDGPQGSEQPSSGWRTLREAGADLDDTHAGVFTSALALAQWHARHPHCPRCGAPTVPEQGGWLRRCTEDGSEHYPRTDAAVIVAVTDPEDRLLLARGPHWPERRMSVLAGFVEAGESLEATVVREVAEEVGLRVGDVVYRGNQPWPFPASLMIGFTARAGDRELHLDQEEIVQAEWFTRGELNWAVRSGRVELPPRVSIARRLVEDWFGGEIEPAEEVTGPFRGTDS
jgi:NAD+ diphosphatase